MSPVKVYSDKLNLHDVRVGFLSIKSGQSLTKATVQVYFRNVIVCNL